jgi:hypothetical protein
MVQRGVAPAPIVVGQRVVGRAEVGGRDDDGAREAPLGVALALHLVAGSAAQAVVEQRGAQSSRVGAVSLAVKIAIPAGPAHGARGIAAPVEGGVGRSPGTGATSASVCQGVSLGKQREKTH